jgi:integrase
MLTETTSYRIHKKHQNPNSEVCMKGSIYTSTKCPICKGAFKFDENIDTLVCTGGLTHNPVYHHGKCRLYYKSTTMRFDTVKAAKQQLDHLRVKDQRYQAYDPRDYQKDVPLGFTTLADLWLKYREKNAQGKAISDSTVESYRNYLRRAKAFFANANIKDIIESPAKIEDFLFGIEGISEKTRANHRSCLHYFFKWVCRRERLQMPEFPDVPFELEFRTITDWETQVKIIDKVKNLTAHIDDKVWLGIELLATHTNLRPQDLIRLAEADIDIETGVVTFWNPTKRKNQTKTIRLMDDHLVIVKELKRRYPAVPQTPFFRHVGGVKGTLPNKPYGKKYFYKWWIKACDVLGIKGLDLYAGTRHTSATQTARRLGKDAARAGLGNTSNKSIERYIQVQDDGCLNVVRAVDEMRRGKASEKIVNISVVRK